MEDKLFLVHTRSTHVAEASHVPALAAVAMAMALELAMVSWQSHAISNSIYSPHSSRSN
jgi:hypothetical protein